MQDLYFLKSKNKRNTNVVAWRFAEVLTNYGVLHRTWWALGDPLKIKMQDHVRL